MTLGVRVFDTEQLLSQHQRSSSSSGQAESNTTSPKARVKHMLKVVLLINLDQYATAWEEPVGFSTISRSGSTDAFAPEVVKLLNLYLLLISKDEALLLDCLSDSDS